MLRRLKISLIGIPLSLAIGVPASAQIPRAPGFDPDRAMLSERPNFDAFRPTTTRPLADALEEGTVREDTPVLVLRREDRSLALLTLQMAYHHVAQGELEGEPWMVSF